MTTPLSYQVVAQDASDMDALASFSEAIEDAYPEQDELNFSDLEDLDGDQLAAVVHLGMLRLLLGLDSDDLSPEDARLSGADKNLLRGELAMFLYRGGKSLPQYTQTLHPGVSAFPDIVLGSWYAEAFDWGKTNNLFYQGRPGDTLNNAEAVTAVRRWLGLAARTPKSGEAWYDPEFDIVAEVGILPEDFDKAPGEPASRGFIAQLIDNAIIQGSVVLQSR